MKYFGVLSCNIHVNFTNYGSALQSWALCKSIDKLGENNWKSKLIDYCPERLRNVNTLNPIEIMWDTDEESRKMCELSLPAIRENYYKFDRFYTEEFMRTKKEYNKENFNQIVKDEELSGFVNGSDTIFCIDEFGFDDGYYANYECMKDGYTVSYAASFGDSKFSDDDLETLNSRLKNFKYIALRENLLLEHVKQNANVPVKKVLDPTLLLKPEEYSPIIAKPQSDKKYILLYSRRYNKKMEDYAKAIAEKNNCEIIEISLRATNAEHHRMFYEAGVEEFLSLIKNAEFVVTNSYHGMIFSILFKKEFAVFARDQHGNKIKELLELLKIDNRLFYNEGSLSLPTINYDNVHSIIEKEREKSIKFLNEELNNCK